PPPPFPYTTLFRSSAPFAHAAVENHIPALVREDMLEIQVLLGLGARHDEDQVCHDRLRRIPADLHKTRGSLTNGRAVGLGVTTHDPRGPGQYRPSYPCKYAGGAC